MADEEKLVVPLTNVNIRRSQYQQHSDASHVCADRPGGCQQVRDVEAEESANVYTV